MKNKDFEAFIQKVIEKYTDVLLLQRHTFDVTYDATMEENAIMESAVRYPYLNGEIKYGETALKMWKAKKDMKPYVIHELCHSLTDPLYCKAIERYTTSNNINDERERLTDVICNIILNSEV